MNIRWPDCFVLGGVLQVGGRQLIDLAPLTRKLRLQSNVGEIKLKHIATGGFLDLLRSAKLEILSRMAHRRAVLGPLSGDRPALLVDR